MQFAKENQLTEAGMPKSQSISNPTCHQVELAAARIIAIVAAISTLFATGSQAMLVTICWESAMLSSTILMVLTIEITANQAATTSPLLGHLSTENMGLYWTCCGEGDLEMISLNRFSRSCRSRDSLSSAGLFHEHRHLDRQERRHCPVMLCSLP